MKHSLLGLLTTFKNCSLLFLNKKIVKPFFLPSNARTVLVHVASGDVLDVVQCFDQGVVFYDSLVSTRPDRDRPGQDDSPMYSVLQNHFAVNLL